MKGKLGIVFGIMCVISFFLYRTGESNKVQAAKEVFVKGKVIDATNDKPIHGVYIAVAGTNPKSASDENGDFMVLSKTTDDLIFRHPDYKSTVISAQDSKIVRLDRQNSKTSDNDSIKAQIKRDFPEAVVE